MAVLPTDSQARKDIPLTSGVLDYFPAALAAVAAVSKAGNDKHNPGQPLHWARGKSTDQADSLVRHLLERGGVDPDTGQRHTAMVAWRALALLQIELEEAGEAPVARGARFDDLTEYGEITDYTDRAAADIMCGAPDESYYWVCERRLGHSGPHACKAGNCEKEERRWPQ